MSLATRGRSPIYSIGGFTLIEVIIVVVVVSILMAIALPAYESSMQKNRRTQAKEALMDVANQQEQHMLDQGTYTDDMVALGFGADPYVTDDGNGYYSVDAADCGNGLTRCYVLTANPVAGSAQAKDTRCTQFTLNSNGLKSASGSDANNCW